MDGELIWRLLESRENHDYWIIAIITENQKRLHNIFSHRQQEGHKQYCALESFYLYTACGQKINIIWMNSIGRLTRRLTKWGYGNRVQLKNLRLIEIDHKYVSVSRVLLFTAASNHHCWDLSVNSMIIGFLYMSRIHIYVPLRCFMPIFIAESR